MTHRSRYSRWQDSHKQHSHAQDHERQDENSALLFTAWPALAAALFVVADFGLSANAVSPPPASATVQVEQARGQELPDATVGTLNGDLLFDARPLQLHSQWPVGAGERSASGVRGDGKKPLADNPPDCAGGRTASLGSLVRVACGGAETQGYKPWPAYASIAGRAA